MRPPSPFSRPLLAQIEGVLSRMGRYPYREPFGRHIPDYGVQNPCTL